MPSTAMTAKDHARVSARVPSDVLEAIEAAAALVGSTVNQFVVQSAQRDAMRVVEQERIIRASVDDTRLLESLLMQAPTLNANLAKAFERNRTLMESAKAGHGLGETIFTIDFERQTTPESGQASI